MRRFSSEGSLLDLDFLPWRTRVTLNEAGYDTVDGESGTYTPCPGENERDCKSKSFPPIIREPEMSPGTLELSKKHSTSVENLTELNKVENNLRLGVLSEGCRAYSDSQLASTAKGSTDSMESYDHLPSSPTYSVSSNPFSSRSHQGQHTRAKLSAAKLHLKSLFGQSPHSSHSNLFNPEQTDSGKERRSRLKFMRQWSQVGHSKGKFSCKELEKWAVSLTSLLASQTGVSVFGAFLRSEFSEENLQFYLACEQYEHSSNNFSLQRRAMEICTTYIQTGASREVNLDSKTRDLTMQLLQAPSHTSLSHAQKRIYSLLDTDCYPRFLQSNIYLSLLREAD